MIEPTSILKSKNGSSGVIAVNGSLMDPILRIEEILNMFFTFV